MPNAKHGPGGEPTQPWFAGKDVDTLLYRINRRTPVTGETLFPQPDSVLRHLREVLSVSVSVETGRAYLKLTDIVDSWGL